MYRNHGMMTDTIREQVNSGIGSTQPICKDYLNNCCNRAQCRFRHQRPFQRDNAEEIYNLRKEMEYLKREVGDLRLTNSLLIQMNSDLKIRLAGSQLGAATSFPLTLCAASSVVTTRNRQFILPVSAAAQSAASDAMGGIISCTLSSFPQLFGHYTHSESLAPSIGGTHPALPSHLYPNSANPSSFTLELSSHLGPGPMPATPIFNNTGAPNHVSRHDGIAGTSPTISSAFWATLMAAAVTSPAASALDFLGDTGPLHSDPSSDVTGIFGKGFQKQHRETK